MTELKLKLPPTTRGAIELPPGVYTVKEPLELGLVRISTQRHHRVLSAFGTPKDDVDHVARPDAA